MLQHLHQVSNKICIRYNMKVYNEYKSYLRPDEDVVTSKISPVHLFTLLH